MHQQVNKEKPVSQRDQLLGQKHQLVQNYRAAVKWACSVLDYKRRFEREEDFGADGLQDYIKILKDDSRRETKSVATNIKILRNKIREIDKRLMDLSKEKTDD